MSDHPVTRLVLIRHGESVSTVARRIGGFRTCGGLSDQGRRQSEQLRDRLGRTGEVVPTALYSSQFARARETAEIVGTAFGGAPAQEEAGFGEHDPGETCDGMTFEEFTAAYGTRDWQNPYAETFPDGETLAEFHHRVGNALHRVIQTHRGGTVVVFCHGGVIDAAFRILLRMPPTGAFQLHTLNTAITQFAWVLPYEWQLSRYNDAAHLQP